MNLTPEEAQRLLELAQMALNTIARDSGLPKLQAIIEAAKSASDSPPETETKTGE